MSIVRNTVVLRNAALGALVVLALFECNGFVAVRFGIKGVFCKENRSNTLRTSRVHGQRLCTRNLHGRLQGPTRPVHGRVRSRVHMHTCTPPIQGRVRAIYTAWTRPELSRIHGPCTRPRTRPVVYMAGRPTGPCTRSQTARYGCLRPVTAYGPCTRPCTRPV